MKEIRTEDIVDEAILPQCDEIYFARPVDKITVRRNVTIRESDDCFVIEGVGSEYREDKTKEGES